MADHVPPGAEPHEGIGGHQREAGHDLAAQHEGETGTADHHLVATEHLRRARMAQGGLPARHYGAAIEQRRLVGMKAEHHAGGGPQLIHRLVVAIAGHPVDGAVDGEHGVALLVTELRRGRQDFGFGWKARHWTYGTPWLRG